MKTIHLHNYTGLIGRGPILFSETGAQASSLAIPVRDVPRPPCFCETNSHSRRTHFCQTNSLAPKRAPSYPAFCTPPASRASAPGTRHSAPGAFEGLPARYWPVMKFIHDEGELMSSLLQSEAIRCQPVVVGVVVVIA